MSGIGDYVHLVALERAAATPDDPEGGYDPAFAPLVPPTWYCAIDAATTRDLERISGGMITTHATHLIRGAYHPQLAANCRIRFRDRIFDVVSVHDRDQLQTDLDVIAREVTTTLDQPAVAAAGRPARGTDGRPAAD
jgi:hypothetical protein